MVKKQPNPRKNPAKKTGGKPMVKKQPVTTPKKKNGNEKMVKKVKTKK